MVDVFAGVLLALVAFHVGRAMARRWLVRALRWYGAMGAYSGWRSRTPWITRTNRAGKWGRAFGVAP